MTCERKTAWLSAGEGAGAGARLPVGGNAMAESLVAWGHSEPLANIQEAITDVLKTMRAAHSGPEE